MTDELDKTPGELARHWQIQLELAGAAHKDFIDDGRKVYERYKSERKNAKTNANRSFNILYSNTEVLRAALYGRQAKPDVRRRFPDRNPVARQTAEVLERALIYSADCYDVDRPIELALQDYCLPGRAVARVVYEPVFAQRPAKGVMGMPAIGEDGEPAMKDFIAERKVRIEYVYWEDFLCEPARNWKGVGWVAYRHTLSRDELRHEIYEEAPEVSQVYGDPDRVPLNWAPDIAKDKSIPEDLKKAEIWEIWAKKERKRYWVVKGCPFVLRVDEDPYGLEGFFDLPEPPASYSTTDSIIPVPEFHAYRDQADDLDEITARISKLTAALRRRGVYDKAIAELQRLPNLGDNQFVPVENYAALAQKGGLAQAFQTEDITIAAGVLSELYKQRDLLVTSIYEVMGMSDIMRGSSNPNETLGAQQLKAQFGSNRMKRRQRAVQRWIRDLYRIKAELIAEHYDAAILSMMTQIQVTPDMAQMLREDKLRGYNVDIETDSTVFEDAESEKQSRVELLGAMGQFMTSALPVAQQVPQLAPLMIESLGFGLRGFKAGRSLEDKLDEVSQQIEQQAKAPKPPPPPDPNMAKVELEAKKHQDVMAFEQQKFGQQMQLEDVKHQRELAMKAQQDERQMAFEQQRAERDIALRQQLSQQDHGLKRELGLAKVRAARIPGEKLDGEQPEVGDDQLTKSIDDEIGEIRGGMTQLGEAVTALGEMLMQMQAQQAQSMETLARAIAAPVRIQRDPRTGLVAGAVKDIRVN